MQSLIGDLCYSNINAHSWRHECVMTCSPDVAACGFSFLGSTSLLGTDGSGFCLPALAACTGFGFYNTTIRHIWPVLPVLLNKNRCPFVIYQFAFHSELHRTRVHVSSKPQFVHIIYVHAFWSTFRGITSSGSNSTKLSGNTPTVPLSSPFHQPLSSTSWNTACW